ncbi:MAG: lipid-A-disaccharide synthase [Burkholderiaceae bacterium]
MTADALTLGMVAGETSGDLLAGAVLGGLTARGTPLRAAGIGGPTMQAHGFEAWWSIEALSVNGYAEVLREYPRLRRMRNELRRRLIEWRPRLFVGVDAPDFNLDLEASLRAQGIRVAHFIGPSVWAWRRERLAKIRDSVDHMLLVFPFEEAIYREAGIPATYVGHPLADAIPLQPDTVAARAALGLSPQAPVVALLPGSRPSEVRQLLQPFLRTALWLSQRRRDVQFVLPAASAALFERIRAEAAALAAREAAGGALPLTVVSGRSHDALAAADAVLVASGTATLETALFRRPMVIAYRVSALSYQLMKRMAYLPYVGLPNILCGRFVVPEFLQAEVRPDAMGEALLRQLEDRRHRESIVEQFGSLHESLRRGCAARAAQALLELADA